MLHNNATLLNSFVAGVTGVDPFFIPRKVPSSFTLLFDRSALCVFLDRITYKAIQVQCVV